MTKDIESVAGKVLANRPAPPQSSSPNLTI